MQSPPPIHFQQMRHRNGHQVAQRHERNTRIRQSCLTSSLRSAASIYIGSAYVRGDRAGVEDGRYTQSHKSGHGNTVSITPIERCRPLILRFTLQSVPFSRKTIKFQLLIRTAAATFFYQEPSKSTSHQISTSESLQKRVGRNDCV